MDIRDEQEWRRWRPLGLSSPQGRALWLCSNHRTFREEEAWSFLVLYIQENRDDERGRFVHATFSPHLENPLFQDLNAALCSPSCILFSLLQLQVLSQKIANSELIDGRSWLMLLKKISLQSYCKVTRKKKKYKHFEDPMDCVEFNDLKLRT